MGERRRPKLGLTFEVMAQYAGRWIARSGRRIIGQGGTPKQALREAKANRPKEVPEISYVPTSHPLEFPPLLECVRQILLPATGPETQAVYLVGGSVRDALLGRSTHDLDFVVDGEALALARKVADSLNGFYYTLDEKFQIGRVLLLDPHGERHVLDFTRQRCPNLEADLRARDFTINAMAVSLENPQQLYDPLGGVVDLHKRRLRTCSPQSIAQDPIRILRGVRLATAYQLRMEPETRNQLKQSVGRLPLVSPERMRDELFRILEGRQPTAAIRALDLLGATKHCLPELDQLHGLKQSPPHIDNVWEHTIRVVDKLDALLFVLGQQHNPEASADLILGMAVLKLGRYRQQINLQMETRLNIHRPLRGLLFLAALYHDCGKPQTRSEDLDGRIRFLQHERVGAELARKRAMKLHLSNVEIQRLVTIIQHHLRPKSLAQVGREPSQRSIYRFFRDTGPAGVDICLLSLADTYATYGHTLSQDTWEAHLKVVRRLLEAYWEASTKWINPTPLLNGHDLIQELGISPGPRIGQMLAALLEFQASGEIQSREQALEWARGWIRKHPEI